MNLELVTQLLFFFFFPFTYFQSHLGESLGKHLAAYPDAYYLLSGGVGERGRVGNGKNQLKAFSSSSGPSESVAKLKGEQI